jgi:hypothetical protein
MNTKELVKKLTAGMPKRIDNCEQRRQARTDYSKGRSMSLFDRAHGEQRPNRKVWSLFDSHNFSMDSGETDTTGFKESNRDSHAATAERSRQERERVNAAIERNTQGEDAQPETEQYYERQSQPAEPPAGKRFVNEVERRNYERLNYMAS